MDIAIPFPKDLCDMIVIRSGGRLDPVALAVSQVEQFVDRNRQDPNFWTDEGLGAFADEEPETPTDSCQKLRSIASSRRTT